MTLSAYHLPAIAGLCLLTLAGGVGCGGARDESGLTKEAAERRQRQLEDDLAESPVKKPGVATAATSTVVAATPPPPLASPSPGSSQENLARRQRQLQDDLAEAPAAVRKAALAPPQTNSRPKDAGDWKQNDYLSAKRDGDPRLMDAVTRLGERSTDKENAAELLTKLLESSANEPPASNADDGDGPSLSSTASAKLTQAIVAALIANGTPRARKTLEHLVAGTFKTTNPQAAMAAAVEALSDRPCPENEDLLFRFVAAQNKAIAGDQTIIGTENIRRTAIAKLASAASEPFRIRLANHMLEPETPQPVYDQLWACLKEPNTENIVPQIVLYRSNSTDRVTRQLLEKQFSVQSSAVMRLLLSVPKPREANASEVVVAKDRYRIAERFWGSDLAEAVQRRLRALDSLENGTSPVSLASTLPNASVRAALLRTLEKHWDEGPQSLESLGVHDNAMIEPGFVALVKMLPRKDTMSSATTTSASGREDGELPAAVTKRDEKRRKEQTLQQWMDFSKNIVRSLCQRLHEATRENMNVEEDFFPFKLHPRADVVAVYRLSWPEDLGGKVVAAPSLQVRYVRIEQKSQPAKVVAYYRRQLSNRKEHPIPGGWWLDSLTRDQEQNRVRSIDVLLTRAKVSTAVRSLSDQEQLLVVEILSVQCDDMGERTSPSARK